MMRYVVVVERGATSWGAHVPDLPSCVAVGETRVEVLQLIREAIEFHIAANDPWNQGHDHCELGNSYIFREI